MSDADGGRRSDEAAIWSSESSPVITPGVSCRRRAACQRRSRAADGVMQSRRLFVTGLGPRIPREPALRFPTTRGQSTLLLSRESSGTPGAAA
jgi:hypothetical protein